MLALATVVFKIGDHELFRSTGAHIPAVGHEVWVDLPQGPGLFEVAAVPRHTFKNSTAFSSLDLMYAGEVFDVDPGPVYVQLRQIVPDWDPPMNLPRLAAIPAAAAVVFACAGCTPTVTITAVCRGNIIFKKNQMVVCCFNSNFPSYYCCPYCKTSRTIKPVVP